ncbi:MAG TPA: nuclear transport factor 2 family protein [Chryseolinea sp.]|nr:nuclear transport factor 2 family protein [Chryseolinea sp.]
MKKLIIACSLLFYAGCLYAQNKEIETEIRALEQTEVQAVLKKDTVTLLKLWDKDYVVNSPENRVVFAGTTTVDRPVMKKARTSFTREVEQVIIRGDIVISMGGETVTPAGDEPQTGQTVKRRYTNIWMKQATGWKLIARHANVICQPN